MFLYLLYMTKYVCDNLCLSLLELCGFPGFNSDTLQKNSVTLCRLVNWSDYCLVVVNFVELDGRSLCLS